MNRVSVNIIKILCNVDKLNFQLSHIMPHRFQMCAAMLTCK